MTFSAGVLIKEQSWLQNIASKDHNEFRHIGIDGMHGEGLFEVGQCQFNASPSSFKGLESEWTLQGRDPKTAQSDEAAAPHSNPVRCIYHPDLQWHPKWAN